MMRCKTFDISSLNLENIDQICIGSSRHHNKCKIVYIKGLFNGETMIKCLMFHDGELVSRSTAGIKVKLMDNLQILRGIRTKDTCKNNVLDVFQRNLKCFNSTTTT